ncbi:NUDIX hydrolase domain-like protein [Umbelopsis sp. PMI_123]|nr:NUDIX hydrolase domain-like protein [Umbelopsis sp. PMI_123]
MQYADKAREGRQNQVYDENNVRQVAGCIPIDPRTNRVLLITSSKHEGVWVLPKGGWENDETQAEAAARETWEEAGVRGTITRQIGTFVETTKKGNAKAHHCIFEMHINEIMKKWPEKKKRERRWFTYEEALAITATKPYMQEAIRLSSLTSAAVHK